MTTVAKTTHNATLIEPAPLEVVSTLAAAGVDVADIRICVCTDLAADGLHYGDQWLVVVEDRVLVVRQQPTGQRESWSCRDGSVGDTTTQFHFLLGYPLWGRPRFLARRLR